MRYVRKTRVDQYVSIIQNRRAIVRSPMCASSLDGFGNVCGNLRKRSKCWADINAENDKNDEEPGNWGEYPSAGSFSHLAQHTNPKTYRYVTQKSFLYVGRT